MKFSKLIEHNKIFFFRNHRENEAGRLFLDLFSFLKKLKQVVYSLVSICIDNPHLGVQ